MKRKCLFDDHIRYAFYKNIFIRILIIFRCGLHIDSLSSEYTTPHIISILNRRNIYYLPNMLWMLNGCYYCFIVCIQLNSRNLMHLSFVCEELKMSHGTHMSVLLLKVSPFGGNTEI